MFLIAEPGQGRMGAKCLSMTISRPFSSHKHLILYSNDKTRYTVSFRLQASNLSTEAVYRSEDATGHRNRAIAHLLLANDVLAVPPDKSLDLYFRQCSISVTACDLARMGATFANMGQNPIDKSLAFDLNSVRRTLSVMFTCGMYDYAGHWAYDVGIPAKSGVGGGIVGVINRQLGIGSYSPRLDPKGNSVRGVASFEMLAEDFGLHAFDCTNVGSTIVSSLIR